MPASENSMCKLIHDIALDGFDKSGEYEFEKNEILSKVKNMGSELWVDTGDLERARGLWKSEMSALTTNNTLANQVVQTGVMDEEIKKAVERIREALPSMDEDDLIFEIGFIINCKIALRLAQAFNTKVSVELHPAFSQDKEKSIVYAKRYYSICPEKFIIKIPLTPEGYLAVRELAKDGMPINFTLGFSVRQNYLAACLSNPNYVNIFLGRLNAVVHDNSLGDGQNVGEAVTQAAQKALDELKHADPAVKTKLIAASIRDWKQVVNLAGINVLTIPPKAVEDLLTSGIDPAAINRCQDRKFHLEIDNRHIERFNVLWTVDAKFKQFTDTLLRQNIDSFTGSDLTGFCEDNGIDLFYRFSDTELDKIKDHGKIPRLSDWDERIALDNLMTTSALQSFTKDQEALDARIRNAVR